MTPTRKLHISVGDNRFAKTVTPKQVTWDVLSKRLLDVRHTKESYADYIEMSPARQTAIKDQGFFVGGQFSGNRRNLAKLISRSIIALDIDHLTEPAKIKETYNDLEYVVHSTHKHSSGKPRLRLVFPLTRDLAPAQYEPAARMLAKRLGLDYFDDTTFQPARVMFWGTTSNDADVLGYRNEGEWTNPDELLSEYTDWKDTTSWPTSKREGTIKHRAKEAADPMSAPGVIGAFNRVFDIHAAIEHFDLPYEMVAGSRYRFLQSTGGPGAIAYDDIFLYTHHESDPAYGHIRNAFDLVRVHWFGEDKEDGTPIMKRPSMQCMIEVAMKEQAVVSELAADEFEALDEPETAADRPKRDLSYDGLLADINTSLQGDIRRVPDLLKAIAVSRKITPAEESLLLRALNGGCTPPPGLRELKLTLAQTKQKLAPEARGRDDIERLIMDRVLKQHYASGRHLKRWSEQWWAYKGGVWREEDGEVVRGLLGETVLELKEKFPEEAKALAEAIGESKTSAVTGQLWKLFCSYVAVKEKDNPDPLRMHQLTLDPVVNCLNGEIHFDESGLYDFTKHDYRHYLTHQLNVDYDPDAECPHWDQFIDMIMQNMQDPQAVKQYLYEICGYLIQPDRSLKTWVLMHGEGYNGKSTIGSVLGTLLGRSSAERSLDGYDGSNSHAEAGLVGKLMLLDDDYSEGRVLPDGLVKRLSEAKRVTANPKNAAEFNFVARSVPVVLSNHWPVTRDTSLAIRERAQVIGLNYYVAPEERDERAQQVVLENELPGVLNRFLEGYARLRLRGRFNPPPECLTARDKWVSMSNPVAMWVSECLSAEEGAFLSRTDAWANFSAWSSVNNPGGHRLKRTLFWDRMEQLLSIGAVKTKAGVGYEGWNSVTEEFE